MPFSYIKVKFVFYLQVQNNKISNVIMEIITKRILIYCFLEIFKTS